MLDIFDMLAISYVVVISDILSVILDVARINIFREKCDV